MTERWIIDWDPDPRFPVYTRANVGEVLPMPVSPLNWTMVWEGSILHGWLDGQERFGILRPGEVSRARPSVVGIFAGHLYLNLSAMRLVGVRTPGVTVEEFDQAFFGEHADTPPYQPHPEDECPDCSERISERLEWALSVQNWPELDEARAVADAARAERPELSGVADADLVARARNLLAPLRESFALLSWGGLAAPVGTGIIASVAAGLGDPSLTGKLITAVGDVDSAVPSWALWDLSREIRGTPELDAAFDRGVAGLLRRLEESGSAESLAFLDSFSSFIANYGSRGPNEWDIASPSWETHPDLVVALLERLRTSPDEKSPQHGFETARTERERLTALVRGQLADDPQLLGTFNAGLAAAARFMGWRERTKSVCVKLVNEIRVALAEVGHRMEGRGAIDKASDLMLLMADEVDDFIDRPEIFATALAARRAQYLAIQEIEPFFMVTGDVPPLDQWPRRAGALAAPPASPGDVLTGLPGSPGVARGLARVLLDASSPSALAPGDVLVAPITDPSWTPLFLAAAAVVVDTGALLSHSVIISRELGIPCAVSVTDATRRIPDGTLIEVDGNTGIVRILENGSP